GGRAYASVLPVDEHRVHGLAGEQAGRGLSDQLGLGLVDGAAVVGEHHPFGDAVEPAHKSDGEPHAVAASKAERAVAATTGAALLGELEVLAAMAFGLHLALVAGGCSELARDEPAGRGGQVVAAGLDGGDLGARFLDDVDEVLELPGVPEHPVGVVSDKPLAAAGADVVEGPLGLGACLSGDVGRAVVVAVDVDDLPTEAASEATPVVLLALDPHAPPLTVGGDPEQESDGQVLGGFVGHRASEWPADMSGAARLYPIQGVYTRMPAV